MAAPTRASRLPTDWRNLARLLDEPRFAFVQLREFTYVDNVVDAMLAA
jgi:hypothetical protein